MGRGRPVCSDVLTPREWEVLCLIREGLTNPQIAQRLGVTDSAAKFHVSEILSKLGVKSRQEAADWPSKRQQKCSFVPLPFLTGIRRKFRFETILRMSSASAIAVAGAGFLLLALGVASMNRGAATDDLVAQAQREAGLPDLAYGRGLLFAQEPLTQYVDKYQATRKYASPASLLAMIPSAQDAQSLASQITGDTTAIILDRTSFQSLDQGFLRAQLRAGISIIGLNVTAYEIMVATGFEEFAFAEAPYAEKRRESPAAHFYPGVGAGDEPFYSTLSVTPIGAPYFRYHRSQKTFSDGLFVANLKQHLGGINADIGVRQ
jgi:DNA-binding CsgD family transcriptional regulator